VASDRPKRLIARAQTTSHLGKASLCLQSNLSQKELPSVCAFIGIPPDCRTLKIFMAFPSHPEDLAGHLLG